MSLSMSGKVAKRGEQMSIHGQTDTRMPCKHMKNVTQRKKHDVPVHAADTKGRPLCDSSYRNCPQEAQTENWLVAVGGCRQGED